MTLKLFIQFGIMALFFLNIYLYIMKRALYCQREEAKCAPRKEILKGRLIFGALSVLSLVAILALEVYLNR